MNRLEKKTTATLLIAIFMISTLAFAAIASPEIRLVVEGDGTAVLNPTGGNDGPNCIMLSRTSESEDWYDWAGVQIPYGKELNTFSVIGTGATAVLDVSETNFYYYIENTVLGQVPIMAFVFENKGPQSDETWKLVLAPPAPTYETGDGEWNQLTTPFTTAHLFKSIGDIFYHWTGSEWGSTTLFEELGYFMYDTNSPILNHIVDYVEVSVGTGAATVYVDDVLFDGVTYDFEPESEGPVSMTVNSVKLIDIVRISVNPADVDFGMIIEGESSIDQVIITNEGTVGVTVTKTYEGPDAQFYSDNLLVGGLNVHISTSNPERTVTLTLTIPENTPAGVKTATLVFEAAEYTG